MAQSCRTYINNLTKDDRERKRLEDIHNEVFQKLIDSKLFKKYNGLYYIPQPGDGNYTKSKNFISELNKQYPTPVVGTAFTKPTAHEYVFVNVRNLLPSVRENIQGEAPQGRLFTQLASEETIPSKASLQTLRKLAEFFKRAGIDSQPLNQIVVNGEKLDANGIAFTMEGLIQYVEGKEETVIPEEGMHIAVEIIKQTNPVLYRQMFNKIGQYDLYDRVLLEYRENKLYQLEDGRPNIPKIKDEAIAKLLVEHVIKKNEGLNEKPENLAQTQTFWQRIVQWLQGLFKKPGFNPFEKATENILEGNIGTVKDLREGNVFLQISDKQKRVFDALTEENKKTVKIENPNAKNPDDRSYYIKPLENDRRVKNRVTQVVKDKQKGKFKEQTEAQKKINAKKAEYGVKGHADVEHALKSFINDDGIANRNADGEIIEKGDDGYIPALGENLYRTLKEWAKNLLSEYPENTLFKLEQIGYVARRDLAGTMDFIAILPDGKTDILDWKFIEVNKDKQEDIKWYDKDYWRGQMGEYRQMVQEYDVKPEDLRRTRTIPFVVQYSYKYQDKLPTDISLKSVETPVEINIDTAKYRLPVPTFTELTPSSVLNKLIEKLQGVYEKVSAKDVVGGRKDIKAEQLNSIIEAIREIQVRDNYIPLVHQADTIIKAGEAIVKKYEEFLKSADVSTLSEKEKNQPSKDIVDTINDLAIYTNLDNELGTLIKEKGTEKTELLRVANSARHLVFTLRKIGDETTDKIIAGSRDIEGVLNAERDLDYLTRNFRDLPAQSPKALQLLFKMNTEIENNSIIDENEEIKKLTPIVEKFKEWLKSKGISNKNAFDVFMKKDEKGRILHKRIDEISPVFFTTLYDKTQKGSKEDIKWIKENMNVEGYKSFVEQYVTERKKQIDENVYAGGTEEMNQRKLREKKDLDERFNFKDESAYLQYYQIKEYLLKEEKNFPTKKDWYTKEYINLIENPAALDFFNYIGDRVKYAQEIGYLPEGVSPRTFLPFLRKSFSESGNVAQAFSNIINQFSITEGEIGYGEKDPITGKPVLRIPKYMTRDIGEERGEGEDKYVDYSEVSNDLIKTMEVFNKFIIQYKYKSEREHELRLLLMTEQNKDTILTSNAMKVTFKDGQVVTKPGNEINARLLDEMIKVSIYGQKYVDDNDAVFGNLKGLTKLAFKAGNAINKLLGKDTVDEKTFIDRRASLVKTIDTLNRYFSSVTLGLSPIIGGVNYFGSNFQALIYAGKYFDKTDYVKSVMRAVHRKFTGDEGKKRLGVIDFFMPFLFNKNYKIGKKLSLSELQRFSTSEFLLSFQTAGDIAVQYAVADSMLENATIIDGEIVNIREYLLNRKEYSDRYTLPYEQRKQVENKFESEVEEMKKKNLYNLAKIENDQIHIEGLSDRKSETGFAYRNKIQRLAEMATGSMSEANKRRINASVFGNSFMVFKNWIPRLTEVRTAGLHYNSGLSAYEWGRYRMTAKILFKEGWKSLNLLRDAILLKDMYRANEKGITRLQELWEQKQKEYYEATGEKLDSTLTKEQFFDLVRQNIAAQFKDTLFLLSLIAMFIGAKAIPPDDDESPTTKSWYKYTLKAFDRITQELSFYYNPLSFQQILNGSVFPSLGVITNATRLLSHTAKEGFGFVIGSDKLMDEAHPIKYLMRTFPITKEIANYIPMINSDLAKEMGITVTPQARLR